MFYVAYIYKFEHDGTTRGEDGLAFNLILWSGPHPMVWTTSYDLG